MFVAIRNFPCEDDNRINVPSFTAFCLIGWDAVEWIRNKFSSFAKFEKSCKTYEENIDTKS